MPKKKYKRPKIETIPLDKEISMILMSWNDDDNPPDDPFGAAQQSPQTNPFKQNSFDQPLK